jgi:hypothetical protein
MDRDRQHPPAAGAGCAPAERVEADRAAMLQLPPLAPATGWRAALRLPRDHYVRLDGNDYSVHPAAVGRRVQVAADLERVTVHCDGGWSPSTPAAGLGIKPSPIPPTWTRLGCSAGSG